MHDGVPSPVHGAGGSGPDDDAQVQVGPVPWGWHAAALAVVLAAAAALVVRYDDLPDPYPIHYGLAGTADGFASKSLAVVLLPLLIGLGTVLLVAGGDVVQRRWLRERAARRPSHYDHLDWTTDRSGQAFPLGPANVLAAGVLAGVGLPMVLGTGVAMVLVWGGVAGLVALGTVQALRSRRS